MKPIKVKINGARGQLGKRPAAQIVIELKSIDAALVARIAGDGGSGILGEADVLAGARAAAHVSGRP